MFVTKMGSRSAGGTLALVPPCRRHQHVAEWRPATRGDDVEIAYLLFTLMCPLSMVALVGWWAWSMRRSGGGSSGEQAPARSAVEEAEIVRLRAQLDQLDVQGREQKTPSNG
jgi:hypothetical protein